MTLNPPTTSLASLNGPSTTTATVLDRGGGLDPLELGSSVGDLGGVLLEPG